jgi:hypothetical protein
MHLAVHFAVLSGERRTLDIFFQTIRVGLVVVGLMLYFSEKGLTNQIIFLTKKMKSSN